VFQKSQQNKKGALGQRFVSILLTSLKYYNILSQRRQVKKNKKEWSEDLFIYSFALANPAVTSNRKSGQMTTPWWLLRARAEAAVASVVAVHPHEMPPLMSAAATFFFVSVLSLTKRN
jgi:hypothetical protein